MARSHKKARSKLRRAQPKRAFRQQVDAEVVDTLLRRFVELVKQGLTLMLTQPTEWAAKVLRQHPELLYTAADIPVYIAWAAWTAYEMDWATFCTRVLAWPAWQVVLQVQTQADLDRLPGQFDIVQVRPIELAVHDALKDGDKVDTRPAKEQAAVQDEFAQSIGASRVLQLLKKQLGSLLKRLDAQDPRHPAHRPRTYRTRSFLLADVVRWMLRLGSTQELIRKLEQHPHLTGAVNFILVNAGARRRQ